MDKTKAPPFFYGYIVVAAAFLIMLILGGTMYSYGIFFKPLIAEFGWTRAMTSGAYALYMVLHGLLTIVVGRLNDRFGPRLVMTVCGFFFGLGYLLMSQISAIWQLYLFYGVIIGIGGSGIFVPLVSTVARWFVKRRGLMSGVAVSGIGIGTIIMPLLAGWLISSYNWHIAYAIIGFLSLGLIILAAQFLRRDPGQMGLSPYGSDEVKVESLDSEAGSFSLREAIYTRQFWIVCVICFLFEASQQAIMMHLVPHATDLGISTIVAAGILATIGGLSVLGRIILGSTGDRITIKKAFILALMLVSASLFWLILAKESWMFFLFATVFGMGYGGQAALISPLVAWLFGLRSHGEMLGSVIFGATIGGAVGSLLAGHIFDISGSYQLAFIIMAVMALAALMLTVPLRPVAKERAN